MATFLRKLRVREVSMVPRGANQGADALLFKSADPMEETAKGAGLVARVKKFLDTLRDVDKSATTFDTSLAIDGLYRLTNALSDSVCSILRDDEVTPDARLAALNTTIDQFRDTLLSAASGVVGKDRLPEETPPMAKTAAEIAADEAEAAKLKKTAEALVVKSAEVIDLEARIAKSEAERNQALADLKKAQETQIEKDREVLAKAMVGDSGLDIGAVTTLLKIGGPEAEAALKTLCAKTAAVTKASEIFVEVGKSNANTPTAMDEITKAAVELQKADPKLSLPQAVTKALHNDPLLYEKSIAR